jgi:hypothetical protein
VGLTDGDLDGVELPRDLDLVRGALQAAADPAPLLWAIAARDSVALAELVCGSRAVPGAAVARAALPFVEALEAKVSARGLYPRLVDLAGAAAGEVLEIAAGRHPSAGWLVPLSDRVEGPRAGMTHLRAAAGHPAFSSACHAHAGAGHVEALIEAAGELGRAEPAAALVEVDEEAAVRAAAAALDAGASDVVALLAAAWGPEPDALVRKLVPRLRTRSAAETLQRDARHLPITSKLLAAVLPGMAR